MPTKNITISGSVYNQETKKGIANLKVEALDKDMLIKASIGSGVTDLEGRFEIIFTNEYLTKMFKGRKVILYFKVFFNDKLIESTDKTVLWNIEEGEKVISILINFPKKESDEIPPSVNNGTDENNLITLSPNLLTNKFNGKTLAATNEKEYFKEIFIKGIKEKLVEIAGEDRATLQKIIENLNIRFEEYLELDISGLFFDCIIPEINKYKIQDAELADIRRAFGRYSHFRIRAMDIFKFDAPIN